MTTVVQLMDVNRRAAKVLGQEKENPRETYTGFPCPVFLKISGAM